MRHTVSTQDAGFEGQWIEMAAFRWFTDARHYALRASGADNLSRLWIVESKDGSTHYYQRGAEVLTMTLEG